MKRTDGFEPRRRWMLAPVVKQSHSCFDGADIDRPDDRLPPASGRSLNSYSITTQCMQKAVLLVTVCVWAGARSRGIFAMWNGLCVDVSGPRRVSRRDRVSPLRRSSSGMSSARRRLTSTSRRSPSQGSLLRLLMTRASSCAIATSSLGALLMAPWLWSSSWITPSRPRSRRRTRSKSR